MGEIKGFNWRIIHHDTDSPDWMSVNEVYFDEEEIVQFDPNPIYITLYPNDSELTPVEQVKWYADKLLVAASQSILKMSELKK